MIQYKTFLTDHVLIFTTKSSRPSFNVIGQCYLICRIVFIALESNSQSMRSIVIEVQSMSTHGQANYTLLVEWKFDRPCGAIHLNTQWLVNGSVYAKEVYISWKQIKSNIIKLTVIRLPYHAWIPKWRTRACFLQKLESMLFAHKWAYLSKIPLTGYIKHFKIKPN